MSDILVKYKNGNTDVTILKDGTKIREFEDFPQIEHPESLDVKITNYCDLGCSYCHENSTTNGKHADLDMLFKTITYLPAGVELAIGGGNPLSHPNLLSFLNQAKDKGWICNMTVNQSHLLPYNKLINNLIDSELITGLGISIINTNFDIISELMQKTNNIVFHVISGVNNVKVISELIKLGNYCKVLILGYKTFGRGIKYKSKAVEMNMKQWSMFLPNYFNKCTLSFDNLAIEQLKLKRFFSDKAWSTFYMGDDFTFTMYIDAVKQEFAPTSRSGKNRSKFSETTLFNYFKNRDSSKV